MNNSKYTIVANISFFPAEILDTLIDRENIQISLNNTKYTLKRDLNEYKGDDTLFNDSTAKTILETYKSLYSDETRFKIYDTIDYLDDKIKEYSNSKTIIILEDPVFLYIYSKYNLEHENIDDIILDYTYILTKSEFNNSVILNTNYEIIRNDNRLDITFEENKQAHSIKGYDTVLDSIYNEENKIEITKAINEIVDGIGKNVLEKFKFNVFSLEDLKKYVQRYK